MPRSRKTDEATTDGPRHVCGAACCATARFEEVPAAADASMGVVSYDQPRFERGWHYHPEVELTLILESSGQRFVGDHIGNFEPGDLVLLGGNVPHVWRSDLLALPRRQRARSIYVHFRSAWLENLAGDLHELQDIGGLLEQAARGLCFSGPESGHAAREMERLPGLSGMRRLLVMLELLQSLAEAGGGVPLSSAGFSPVLDHRTGERIRRIHSHVYQNFRSGISHQDLARLAGLSPAALSKFFRRSTGRTITQFINEVRVGEAARLLIDSDGNISQIAYASGFESLAHFNATFRHLKQVNPTRFRELHRME